MQKIIDNEDQRLKELDRQDMNNYKHQIDENRRKSLISRGIKTVIYNLYIYYYCIIVIIIIINIYYITLG